VPRVLRAFSAACPEVALTLEEGLSNELIDRLGNERLDVAFVRVAASTEGLAFLPLLEEPMVLALPAGHPLADGGASIAMKWLQAETFILAGPPGTGLHGAIIEACRAAGFSPRVGNVGAATQQAPRISSTLSLVAAGLGITCVPASLMRLDMEGVVFRQLVGRARPKAALGLTSRRGDPSAVVRRFVALVRREARAFSAAAAGA
jgi:DNA-binding transcriptional LysR family regulator